MNKNNNTLDGLSANVINEIELIEFTAEEKALAGADQPGRRSYHSMDNKVIIENIHPSTRLIDKDCWYVFAGKREIKATQTFLVLAEAAVKYLKEEIAKGLQ